MDCVTDKEVYVLHTISSHTEYLCDITCESNSESFFKHIPKLKDMDIHMREMGSKRGYTVYTDQDKDFQTDF